MQQAKPSRGQQNGASQSQVHPRPRLNSRDLFAACREIIIEHASDEYRLRLTSQGKLILTK